MKVRTHLHFTFKVLWHSGVIPGVEVLGLFVRRDAPFFRVSFSPILSQRAGLSKEGNFSGVGCQNLSKGQVLLDRVYFECFERHF